MTGRRHLLVGLLLAPGLFPGCSQPPPPDPAHVAQPAGPTAPPQVMAPENGAPVAATTPENSGEEVAADAPGGGLTGSDAPPPAAPAEPEAPSRVVAVAGKPGAKRIGVEKCKMCHKVQHASWAESAHARQSPALDCESCHGPGSEYQDLAVMKDPDKSAKAGLVRPGRSFCTASCHVGDWNDDMLGRSHAHKAQDS